MNPSRSSQVPTYKEKGEGNKHPHRQEEEEVGTGEVGRIVTAPDRLLEELHGHRKKSGEVGTREEGGRAERLNRCGGSRTLKI